MNGTLPYTVGFSRAALYGLALLLCVFAPPPSQAEEPGAGLSPKERSYLLWRQGYYLHLMGEYESAIERFSQSIEIHPTADAHTYRGWSLSKLQRLEEAIDDCKEAIRLDPDFGNPYNDIGVYLIGLGRPGEAIPWLKKAMRARRYCCYQFAHFNLGRVLLMQGRVGEAKRLFKKALEFQPDYQPALRALEFIRRQGWEST